MKKLILAFTVAILTTFTSKAQWNDNGNCQTTGNLTIGSSEANSYSKLVIIGPNQPNNSGSYRDISFEFNAAGTSLIRSYRGGGWDTYLQFLTTSSSGGSPQTRMHIDHIGNIGVGTTAPSAKLEIRDGNVLINNDAGNSHELVFGNKNHGVKREGNEVSLFTAGGVESGILFAQKTWLNNGWNGWQVNMKITNTGNVGIGTTDPQSKLAVNGQIRATEVKVLALIDVPDYVFEADYNLRSLKDTKEYISVNKHLPEIPSASEIGENGIDLGDMNMKLLKKIEELTLHLIKQNEKLEAQQLRIEKLEKQK